VNVLDLFSGIGGFSLGLERAGMSTVAFCETDDYCRRVLARRALPRDIMGTAFPMTSITLHRGWRAGG